MDAKKIIEKSKNFLASTMQPMGNESETQEKTNDSEKDYSSKKVTIYGLSTCPWCKKARKFFTEKGATVEYIEYDKADEETRKHIEEDCKSYMDELGFPVAKDRKSVV